LRKTMAIGSGSSPQEQRANRVLKTARKTTAP
jgi:hypothetical protein